MSGPGEQGEKIRALALLCGLLLIAGCSGGGDSSGGGGSTTAPPAPGAPRTVVVSWGANHESAVNRAGGGYRVYYSTTPGFALGSGTLINVPYAGGTTAPTTTNLALTAGTYYFKVAAYSTLNAAGSAASAEIQVVVPN